MWFVLHHPCNFSDVFSNKEFNLAQNNQVIMVAVLN